MATTTATDVLSATDNYGKANTAFALALQQASNQREAAMIGLGADFSSQAGKVYTPNEVGGMLGGAGLDAGTTIKTGFGEGALATIDKTAVGNVYQQQEALDERGVGGTSGISQQAKALVGDQQGLASQQAVQDFQGQVAEANLAQATAKADLADAGAALDTATGDETAVPKPEGAKTDPKSLLPLRKNTAGRLVKASNRGNYKAKVNPKGANLPKNPKAGQSFKGKGGVTSVYRPGGPDGAGWYKKGGAGAPTPKPDAKKAPVPTGKPESKKGAVIPKPKADIPKAPAKAPTAAPKTAPKAEAPKPKAEAPKAPTPAAKAAPAPPPKPAAPAPKPAAPKPPPPPPPPAAKKGKK
jgi:hypothetical protein